MAYGLHLAKIYGYPEWSEYDDRLFVQITPEMDNITTNLPCWPYFFRDEQFVGKTGDLVWVICDDEFSVGYILGQANYFAYPEDQTTFLDYSMKEDFKKSITNITVDLLSEQLSFTDIKVQYWNNHSIHFVERSTGGFIIAYDSGSILIMRPSHFFVKIADSILKIDAAGISLKGDVIKAQAPEVNLGENPSYNVLVTSGVSGGNAQISENVKA